MNVSNEDRLSALVSLYSTERADLTSIGNQNIAMVGLALTYIVAVVFGLAQSADKKGVSVFWLVSPVPLLVFLAFYTLFIALARARSNTCRVLEERIIELISPELNQGAIGMAVSDAIMDIDVAPRSQKRLILAGYAPLILAIPCLTVYILIRAFLHHTHLWMIITAMAFYVLLLLPTATAWDKELNTNIFPRIKRWLLELRIQLSR